MRIGATQAIENGKLEWEKEKYQDEKAREKQRDRKQLIQSAIANGSSMEEVREMLRLYEDLE